MFKNKSKYNHSFYNSNNQHRIKMIWKQKLIINQMINKSYFINLKKHVLIQMRINKDKKQKHKTQNKIYKKC